MPRGYLSARVDDGNPLHHVWNNNGTWWCHYTLHWDHKKRRIRRSLKTPDLATAIARRDELFTRIEREGEEVPDRRPRRKDRDGEEQPMLAIVASLRCVLSHHHPRNPFMQDLQNRSIHLLNADTVLDGARDLLRVVEQSTPLPQTWLDLAAEFERAARLYRQAGLGLMAKKSFEHARQAYEAAGDDAAAARCYARSQAIPVLWKAADE